MLVALSVRNFKSIREARLRFGALTCLIGHNGVGKSNLFDAIQFLGLLAERDISEAAAEVKSTSDGTYSPLDLVFGRDPGRRIEFSADMVVAKKVTDDFGQQAEASTTLLTYTLRLRYLTKSDRLAVESESLTHAKKGDYRKFTGFASSGTFRDSIAAGARRGAAFISTSADENRTLLHGDGGSRGRPRPVGRSPLTVVGGTNTSDYPTVLAAKREMSSWRVLHLEPSAMRTPDTRRAVPHVSASGGRIPATLHALTANNEDMRVEVVNRLRRLNSDVEDLDVDVDDSRDQLALRARIPGVANWLYGRSLSDGTLRYIALVLMLMDVQDRAVLCIEEPENGIHPSRIPDLVELLREYAVDCDEAVAADNPLRQVILNTHSPEVARQLNVGDMVFVERASTSTGGPVSVFRPVAGTWRTNLPNGEEPSALPIHRQAVTDFIGGSTVSSEHELQELEFGSAR
jgi:predicted ATPase